MQTKRIAWLLALTGAISLLGLVAPPSPAGEQAPAQAAAKGFSPYVDKQGGISLPKDYKTKWTHLGGWAVAKKKGQAVHEIHDVYTQPHVVEAYNRTGGFPDGAVLVKEVREAKAEKLTTGHAAWSTDIKIWFVMIKDRKDRFPDHDHWGDGWGWALYEAKDPQKNISTDYNTSCIGCHIPAEDDDWVYVRGYPQLKKKK